MLSIDVLVLAAICKGDGVGMTLEIGGSDGTVVKGDGCLLCDSDSDDGNKSN